jgi:cohesin loading factor subunit SCC2
LKQANIHIQDPEEEQLGSKADRQKILSFGGKVKNALRDIWTDHATDVFDIGLVFRLHSLLICHNLVFPSSQEDVIRIDRFSEEIGSIQGLKNSFQPILNVILLALDAPPVFMRTKALRALGQIVTSDPTILAAVQNLFYWYEMQFNIFGAV